jgi:Bardet-Biedl syndrome 4 protein
VNLEVSGKHKPNPLRWSSLQDYEACLALIEQALQSPISGAAHYPTFTKAMVLRQQGKVQQSHATLEEAVRLDPHNPQNLKQVALSLCLLGKHSMALEVYDEAARRDEQDWEVFHNMGICHLYLRQLRECACIIQEHQLLACQTNAVVTA